MDDGGKYRAFLYREPHDWVGGLVRLVLVKEDFNHRRSYLTGAAPDGVTHWRDVPEDGTAPTEVGLTLPAGSIEAIATAVQEFQGHTSHADTEAKVLREWLAVERARVDNALGK